MTVANNLTDHLPTGDTAIALGFFDGIHLGHQAVISAAVAQRRRGLIPCAFTFTVSGGVPTAKQGQGFLQTEEAKEKILASMGVEYVFCPDFSVFRDLSPREFVDQILVEKYRAKEIFCGENFHFGKGAAGDVASLTRLCAAHGVGVTPIPVVMDEGEPISSTRIRRCIAQGDLPTANRLLGYPYTLRSEVIHGRQLGRRIDCPTTNQRFPKGQLIPKNGVYATVIQVGKDRYIGATNVGRKPTVGSDEVLAETYILDFDRQIYGEVIQVEFYCFLRGERKFASLEELSATIQANARQAEELCQKYR